MVDMKTLIALCALAALLFTACGPRPERIPVPVYRASETAVIDNSNPWGIHLVRIDGCQYLERGQLDKFGYSLTHKGNCDNPIHKHAP